MFQYVPPFPQWQQGCSGQSPAFAMLPGSKGCSKLHGRGKAKTSVPISQKEKPRSREFSDLPGYHCKLKPEAGRGRLRCQDPDTTMGI